MSDPLMHDAERMYEAIGKLVRSYQSRDKERICCHDITLSQWSALEVIVERGPMGLNALAEQLKLDKSTASRLVDGMVRKELVGRLEDFEDRRAVRLEARKAGHRLYEKVRKELIAEEAALIGEFSPEVRASAIELVEKLGSLAQRRAVSSLEVRCSGIEKAAS